MIDENGGNYVDEPNYDSPVRLPTINKSMSPDRQMLNSNSDAFNEAVDYSNYKANKELIMKAKQ